MENRGKSQQVLTGTSSWPEPGASFAHATNRLVSTALPLFGWKVQCLGSSVLQCLHFHTGKWKDLSCKRHFRTLWTTRQACHRWLQRVAASQAATNPSTPCIRMPSCPCIRDILNGQLLFHRAVVEFSGSCDVVNRKRKVLSRVGHVQCCSGTEF